MTEFQAYFLGSPRIERAGEAVHLDTRKALALLAYLALSGRAVHSRDTLAALFWPESDASSARAALRRTLSTLNVAIDGAGLDADRETITLTPSDRLWIDAAAFSALVDAVEAHDHPPGAACAECLSRLEGAADLYAGDFMSGFTLRDSPDFDTWQFSVSESLRRQAGFVLERLADHYAALQQMDAALDAAQRRLRLDPLHEAAHRDLMRLYALAGRRTSALRQYRECVRLLDQELGVPPLEETTQLYEAIQKNELAPSESARASLPVERQARRDRPPGAGVRALPFVGRSGEWAQIVEAHARARQDGYLVMVEGEAGIGKTRLADAYAAYAREDGMRVLAARCYQGEAGLAYGPFVDALREALAEDTGWLDSVQPHWLVEAARLVPGLRTLWPDLPPAPPLDVPGAQSRFFEGVMQTLFAASATGVLLLEDLHWADSASLDLLAYLANRLEGRSWCVFLTWRGEQVPRDHRLRGLAAEQGRAGRALALTLARLSAGAVSDLVAAIDLPDGLSAADLAARLYEETEGLPFFVVEYLSLITAGDLPASGDAWALPGGARDLLHSRLSPVSETGWQVLTTAALMGRSFDFDTLRLASGRSEEEVVDALDELLERGLIREEEDSAPDPRYDFSHSKLREVVQSDASFARRRLLHRRIAAALADRSPRGEAASQIAAHYEQAGDAEQAASYYERAGRHAQALIANHHAIDHYQQAIALGHPAAAALHQTVGDLHTLLGEYGDALRSYETAAALGEPEDLPRLEHKLGRVYHRLGEWDVAEGHFEAALDALDALDTPEADPLRAGILADRSLSAHRRGDADRAQTLAEASLAVAQASGDGEALAQAHNILGVLARTGGRLDAAREHLEHSLSAAESLDDRGAQAAALNNLALVAAAGGDYQQAVQLGQAALDLCHLNDDRHREAAVLNNLADFYHAAGDESASRQSLEQAVVIFAEIGVEAGGYPEIWKLTEW